MERCPRQFFRAGSDRKVGHEGTARGCKADARDSAAIASVGSSFRPASIAQGSARPAAIARHCVTGGGFDTFWDVQCIDLDGIASRPNISGRCLGVGQSIDGQPGGTNRERITSRQSGGRYGGTIGISRSAFTTHAADRGVGIGQQNSG